MAAVRQVAAGRLALPLQVVHQFFAGAWLEAEAVQFRSDAVAVAFGERRVGALEELADALREVEAAVEILGAPERRCRAGRLGRVRQHVVVGDALYAPSLGAEAEGLADSRFPHELLV